MLCSSVRELSVLTKYWFIAFIYVRKGSCTFELLYLDWFESYLPYKHFCFLEEWFKLFYSFIWVKPFWAETILPMYCLLVCERLYNEGWLMHGAWVSCVSCLFSVRMPVTCSLLTTCDSFVYIVVCLILLCCCPSDVHLLHGLIGLWRLQHYLHIFFIDDPSYILFMNYVYRFFFLPKFSTVHNIQFRFNRVFVNYKLMLKHLTVLWPLFHHVMLCNMLIGWK